MLSDKMLFVQPFSFKDNTFGRTAWICFLKLGISPQQLESTNGIGVVTNKREAWQVIEGCKATKLSKDKQLTKIVGRNQNALAQPPQVLGRENSRTAQYTMDIYGHLWTMVKNLSNARMIKLTLAKLRSPHGIRSFPDRSDRKRFNF